VIVQNEYVPFMFLRAYRAAGLLVNMLKDRQPAHQPIENTLYCDCWLRE